LTIFLALETFFWFLGETLPNAKLQNDPCIANLYILPRHLPLKKIQWGSQVAGLLFDVKT